LGVWEGKRILNLFLFSPCDGWASFSTLTWILVFWNFLPFARIFFKFNFLAPLLLLLLFLMLFSSDPNHRLIHALGLPLMHCAPITSLPQSDQSPNGHRFWLSQANNCYILPFYFSIRCDRHEQTCRHYDVTVAHQVSMNKLSYN